MGITRAARCRGFVRVHWGMPRLWTRIAGSLGLLTLAVLVFNAGVFWVVLEQAAVKRQTDLAASLGQAMGAQLGAAAVSYTHLTLPTN